jgi:hypothetical protein
MMMTELPEQFLVNIQKEIDIDAPPAAVFESIGCVTYSAGWFCRLGVQ